MSFIVVNNVNDLLWLVITLLLIVIAGFGIWLFGKFSDPYFKVSFYRKFKKTKNIGVARIILNDNTIDYRIINLNDDKFSIKDGKIVRTYFIKADHVYTDRLKVSQIDFDYNCAEPILPKPIAVEKDEEGNLKRVSKSIVADPVEVESFLNRFLSWALGWATRYNDNTQMLLYITIGAIVLIGILLYLKINGLSSDLSVIYGQLVQIANQTVAR